MGEHDTEPAGAFGPPEDSLQRLWTPHRMVYIGGQDKPADGSVAQCPFCRIPTREVHHRQRVAPGGAVNAREKQETNKN
ncbi:hypothetical protein ABE437_18035, partial [Isoptericola cucumis]